MAPINFGLPGFFKANLSSVDCGWSVYVAPPITGSTFAYHFEADQDVFSDTSNTCAADTDSVVQFYDQSGNNNTTTQTTVSLQPTYVVDGINNKNVISVDNTDEMTLSSPINTEDYTVYGVYKKNSAGDSQSLIGDVTSTSGSLLNWSGGGVYFFNSSGGYRNFVATSDFTSYAIRAFRNFSSNGTFDAYENGFKIGEATGASLGTSSLSALFRRSGRNGTLTVADISIYDTAHSLSEISQITNWLNDKYKIYPDYVDVSLPPVTTNLEDYTTPDYDVYSDIGGNLALNNESIRSVRGQHGGVNKFQTTANRQLSYGKDTFTFNSSFNGATDRLDFESTISFGVGESFTVYSVYKRNNNGNVGLYCTNSGSGGILDWGNGVIYIMGDNGSYNNYSLGYDLNLNVRAYQINRTTNMCHVYNNGVEVASFSIANVSAGMTMGYLFNRHGFDANGLVDFGDQLLYRSLHNTTEIGQITDFLNKKYNVHSYLTQQGGTLPVTSNLLLQIEGNAGVYSDTGISPTVDASNIREITDYSSNSNDLDQSSAGSQLTYETNHFNRKDFIKHTSNRYMSPTTPTNLSGGTVYVTGKKLLENSDWMIIGGDSGSCIYNFSSGVSGLFDGTSSVNVSTGHFTQHAVYAFVWTFGSTYEVYKNGVSLGSVSATSVGQINNIRIFGRGTETATSVNYFGDVLVYSDAHNATQVGQISDYLISKTYDVDTYAQEPTYKKFLAHHFEAENSSLQTNNFIPSSGDTIDIVNDLTHNKVNGSVSGAKQVYHTDEVGINDKPYVQLSTGVMDLDKPIECERTQDWTIFAVVKKDSSSDVLALYGGDNNTSLFSDYSDNKMYFVSPTNHSEVPSMGTGWSIISAVYNAKDDTLKVYKNGTQLGTTQTFSISGPYTINRLFNRGNAVTTSGTGVAESMFYLTELSSAEITAETNRLNTKYDIY